MVRDLWGKRFTKEVSFEFRVKEWRGDGWGKWRTDEWIEVSIKRWNWFTKWKWKLIPEMRRGILKRAICDLKGRGSALLKVNGEDVFRPMLPVVARLASEDVECDTWFTHLSCTYTSIRAQKNCSHARLGIHSHCSSCVLLVGRNKLAQ